MKSQTKKDIFATVVVAWILLFVVDGCFHSEALVLALLVPVLVVALAYFLTILWLVFTDRL